MNKGNLTKGLVLIAIVSALALLFSGCGQDNPRAYQRALDLFAAEEYEEAAKAFERMGEYGNAPTYAAYSRGLVLFGQGAYAEAMPYFEQTQDFMYGKSRHDYCRAYTLETDGAYAEAAEVFRGLTEFEDAAVHADYCQARAAEASQDYQTAIYAYKLAGEYADASDRLALLRGDMYNRAVAFRAEADAKNQEAYEAREAGDAERARGVEMESNANYESALLLFMQLVSSDPNDQFLDSAAQASECKRIFREQQYAQAERLEQEGQLQEAYALFKALSGYNDADTRAQELALRLGIAE